MNCGVGLDSDANYADTVWNTFVGEIALSPHRSKVSNELQTIILLPGMQ